MAKKQWKLDKALVVAVMKGYAEEAGRHLAAGANPNQTLRVGGITTPLLAQVLSRTPTLLSPFLASGALVNVCDDQGVTPLHLCADAEQVTLLLDAGASPSARSHEGYTPLHAAMSQDIAGLLVEAGGDPRAKCNRQSLPWESVSLMAQQAGQAGLSAATVADLQGAADWLRAQVVGSDLQDQVPPVAMTDEEAAAKSRAGRF